MKTLWTAAGAGFLFALGLGLGGMTDPAKVVGFLDVAGDWDFSLAFVMAGAVGTHALLRPLILRRKGPVLAAAFPVFAKTRIDKGLVLGAALFGVGWGLSGYCPGPAFVSLPSGARDLWISVAAMLLGMAGVRYVELGSNAGSAAPRS